MNDYDHLIKLIIVGSSGVGKSTILKMYCENVFDPTNMTTIGVDFRIKTIKLRDKVIKLQIWDTAGQDRFKTITSSYYRGSHAIVLVFDLTNYNTFRDLPMWLGEIKKVRNTADYKIILIGNKADRVNDSMNSVPKEEIKKFIDENKMEYFEISARNEKEVEAAFENVTGQAVGLLIGRSFSEQIVHPNTIPIKPNKTCCS
jgi:Ras-related protein Rab-1A